MDSKRHEEQLDQLTEKELLLEIMAELKTIRYGLQTGNFGKMGREEDDTMNHRCKMCDRGVPATERKQHLIKEHNAPEQINVSQEFERQ